MPVIHRSNELITTQSYTVGLLGPTAASAPTTTSAILDFRRSALQPSPLGVVAAAANGESGTLAGDDGTELDSPDGTASDGGRAIVMLRVTAGAAAATAVDEEDEGEKEEYLRSLPSP